MMYRYIYFLISLVLSGGFTSCLRNPAEPARNPREYMWTVDTLDHPESSQTRMRSIWGSSAKDVYLVGHNDSAWRKMYHYDGKSWTPVKTPPFSIFTLWDVYGFSEDQVWVVGKRFPPSNQDQLYGPLIMHFDGLNWKESELEVVQPIGPFPISVLSIWGISSDDIWAGGSDVVFHYDGQRWKKADIYIPPQGIQFLSISGFSSDDVYMLGSRNEAAQPFDSLTFMLYHYNGQKWTLIDSSIVTAEIREARFGYRLFAVDGRLYSPGKGIWVKTPEGWEKILSVSRYLLAMHGTSSQNLFAVGVDAAIWNYNGKDWYRYPQFSGHTVNFTDVWTDGQEVFAVGNDGRRTYVYHGK